ncbi:hypothetical protein [Ohessyouella blattaphilus]|uniref:Uncharacterized protein n=1 Tax=Ohessyouella blattaphilus TaxID=2949333 RepID=A0ABT1EG52_9FIRM|nr:hypothetical protein [Ohessyouella blattaphilus]MCP1109691.1 hypothetical protein [Ohessyouella blattaphilus]MCR8563085.1 hypothetical protein [Ohessyouella blattaphilus]
MYVKSAGYVPVRLDEKTPDRIGRENKKSPPFSKGVALLNGGLYILLWGASCSGRRAGFHGQNLLLFVVLGWWMMYNCFEPKTCGGRQRMMPHIKPKDVLL